MHVEFAGLGLDGIFELVVTEATFRNAGGAPLRKSHIESACINIHDYHHLLQPVCDIFRLVMSVYLFLKAATPKPYTLNPRP